jgi:hypothetical protein
MLGDDVVQLGLCKFRFITFVVPMSPVAQQVYVNVLPKLLPIIHSQLGTKVDRLRIIAIYMENWRINYFADIRTIDARPRIVIIRGKTHLVVDHKMDGASGSISLADWPSE